MNDDFDELFSKPVTTEKIYLLIDFLIAAVFIGGCLFAIIKIW